MIRLPAAGESFGRYRLDRVLGRGGMGVVYAAHDTTLDRDVAVKLVAPQFAEDAGFRARFQQEAATLARLDSHHVVSIFDHGELDGVLFIVTQLVPGGDLAQRLARDGALAPGLVISLMSQVTRGLADAHAVGVVHRDLKPANVLLRGSGSDVEALLCDFGIATAPGATELSRTGSVTGSLPYMAPERHQGKRGGVAGDVYALGCLFWHLLTGSAPYAGSEAEVTMGHVNGPIPQLPGRDAFSSAASKFLRRAMAKEPAKRHPSARAMLQDLAVLAEIAPEAVALPGATAFRQALVVKERRRRAPALAALATAVVLAGGVGVAAALGTGPFGDPRDPAAGQVASSPGEGTTGKEPRRTEPTYSFQCWNSATPNAHSAADCPPPTGLAGARWIFVGVDESGLGCYRIYSIKSAIEAWRCDYGGHAEYVVMMRWSKRADAIAHANGLLDPPHRTTAAWRSNGNRFGISKYGTRGTPDGPRHALFRIYDDEPWSIWINSPTHDGRVVGQDLVAPYRDPKSLRGVPSS